MLSESSEWFCDGMFGEVPEIVGQLFSIHAVTPHSNTIPMVYVLLPDKMQRTYLRLFEVLKELQVRVFHICQQKAGKCVTMESNTDKF